MRRLLTTLIVLMGVAIQGKAQSNELEVFQVASPIENTNYKSLDSADIIIRIRNIGPNNIEAFDSLRISYSVSKIDTAFEFDTTIVSNQRIAVGSAGQITVVEDYRIEGQGTFSVCAEVTGTYFYPINTSKFPGECSQFIVSVKKADLKPSKVFYSSGALNFELNEVINGRVEIFDITGKVLMDTPLKPLTKQQVYFPSPSRGFYFMKIIGKDGSNSTAKFVVN